MDQAFNVLFVDDEPHVLESFRHNLRRQRRTWKLFFATHVTEAEDLLSSRAMDVVVTDVNMPGRSGLDLLASIRQTEAMRDIPVIIVTGDTEHDLKCKALDMDATDLLIKPVQPADLIARLGNALRLKQMQDALKDQNQLLEQRVKERTLQLENAHEQIIWRLAKAGEFRDEDTGYHILRVGRYSQEIALALGLGAERAELIGKTSPLHDIGKIGIPDAILLKEGRLTSAEWHVMKTHCEIGSDILLSPVESSHLTDALQTPALSAPDHPQHDSVVVQAAQITMCHHERWDGTGYPRGLAGTDIPVSGRITALADVYDALRSARPYKQPFSHQKAVGIITEGAGTHFCPEVFAVFESMSDRFEEIYRELDDDG